MRIGFIKSSYNKNYVFKINTEYEHAFFAEPTLSFSNYGIRIVR